ncbi:unnamed protein product [Urochloa humidicola]
MEKLDWKLDKQATSHRIGLNKWDRVKFNASQQIGSEKENMGKEKHEECLLPCGSPPDSRGGGSAALHAEKESRRTAQILPLARRRNWGGGRGGSCRSPERRPAPSATLRCVCFAPPGRAQTSPPPPSLGRARLRRSRGAAAGGERGGRGMEREGGEKDGSGAGRREQGKRWIAGPTCGERK